MAHSDDNSIKEKASPWHEGERSMQASLGMQERMEQVGQRAIRDFMPEQHQQFYARLPFMVAGLVDEKEQVWATVLVGHPGFVQTPSNTQLIINAAFAPHDPARAGLRDGAGVGFLGIELNTRRRNRVNGFVSSINDSELHVEVEHTMGNCPKYIQHREYEFTRDPSVLEQHVETEISLSQSHVQFIQSADTFYVASYAAIEGRHQVDVSHRGGKPGFVQVGDDGVLTIPDFLGNAFFNTLGNITTNGKAGLSFMDDKTGDILQMTGTAQVNLDDPEMGNFKGAERLWTFKPQRIVLRKGASPLRWSLKEMSPFLP